MTRRRARQATKEEAGISRAPQPTPAHMEVPLHPDPATPNMNFEQAYDYYEKRGTSSYDMHAYGQDFYYPTGMSSCPQVGPSTSARFDFENPITRELSRLSNQLSDISQELQRL